MARTFTDGVDAMVAPPGDAEAFAERICRLLADDQLADRIGAAGRAYAQAHFRYDLYGSVLIDFFARLQRTGSWRSRLRNTLHARRRTNASAPRMEET
jgi:glycosyltransferase involved in cell wall biosynthesis